MRVGELKGSLPVEVLSVIESEGILELRPAQTKAVEAGLLEGVSLLVCTPTASGKTLIAELAMLKCLLSGKKALYLAPLVALASEKAREFSRKWVNHKVALSVGDRDSAEPNLVDADIIVCTSEKLDSLIRHGSPWLMLVGCVVVDEIHLLNDISRGPTLEVVLTLLRRLLRGVQVVGLSATIGNPQELANWLGAKLVLDSWRPVPLKKGTFLDKLEFLED